MYPAPATSSFSNPSIGTDAGDDFLGDLARRLAQALGQLEGKRQREFAELDLRRLFDDYVGQINVVGFAQVGADAVGELLLEMAVQAAS